MTRLGLALAAAMVSVASLTPQPATTPPREIFFDDFSGPALDRAKWNVVVSGPVYNNEQQAYIDSPDTIGFVAGDGEGASNGALEIRPRAREGYRTADGRRFDFVSARLNTQGKFAFARGRASARLRLMAGDGLWPAFWILGDGAWPATGEIDVMEHVGARDWTSVAVHGPGYSGNTPFVQRARFDAGAGLDGWHVYSVDWSADALVFFVDDREIYRVTKAMVAPHGRWAFDNEKYLLLNLALGGEYPRSVNHADAPYPGLPAATVDLIKAGRARYLVDWVRVTAP